jgi:hypothetical protein
MSERPGGEATRDIKSSMTGGAAPPEAATRHPSRIAHRRRRAAAARGRRHRQPSEPGPHPRARPAQQQPPVPVAAAADSSPGKGLSQPTNPGDSEPRPAVAASVRARPAAVAREQHGGAPREAAQARLGVCAAATVAPRSRAAQPPSRPSPARSDGGPGPQQLRAIRVERPAAAAATGITRHCAQRFAAGPSARPADQRGGERGGGGAYTPLSLKWRRLAGEPARPPRTGDADGDHAACGFRSGGPAAP